MKLNLLTILGCLMLSLSACGQTEGRYVSVRTVTDVFFQDTILNIVTSDTTFRDTLFNTGGGAVTGPVTQTLDTIDFDFLSTAANLPGATTLAAGLTVEVPIPWNTSPVRTSSRYTISGSDVSVSVSGWYRVSGHLTTNTSLNQRYNGKVYLKMNGTLSDEFTASGYIRATSSQDQTSLHFDFYTDLTAGVPFQIVQIQEGGSGLAVTLNNTASRLYITPLTQNYVEIASGPAGSNGADGLSAYGVWLAQANIGTEAEFLASLEGAQGPAGPSGGPVGPAGPAGASGVASDTAADGSYYRLFTTDDGGTYYNQGNIDGTAGLELFTSGQGDLYRMYMDDDAMIFDGKAFTFLNQFNTVGIQAETSSTAIFRDQMDFRINSAGTKFSDNRATKKGIEYFADYSTDLKANARSIPDVGTVQQMIDAGGGSAPLAPFQQITSATTISPTKGTAVEFTPSSNATLTINPVNLEPGDVILLFMNNDLADPTFGSTTGLFYGSGGFGISTVSYTAGNRAYLLIWAGTNWHYTQF